MTENQNEYREHLNTLIFRARDFADWIYHDVRLDCDEQAAARTAERLRLINAQYGKDAMFGMTGWWAMKAYWRLADAHKARNISNRPDLLPKNVMEVIESDDPEEKKRAFISAQQFISTMTHDNAEMAEAIFNAAYDAGVEDFVALMWSVLMFSIRISNVAFKMKNSNG